VHFHFLQVCFERADLSIELGRRAALLGPKIPQPFKLLLTRGQLLVGIGDLPSEVLLLPVQLLLRDLLCLHPGLEGGDLRVEISDFLLQALVVLPGVGVDRFGKRDARVHIVFLSLQHFVPLGDLIGVDVAARSADDRSHPGADEGALASPHEVSETSTHRGAYSGPDSRSFRSSLVALGSTAGEEHDEDQQECSAHTELAHVSS
jgi:hypothetical protein